MIYIVKCDQNIQIQLPLGVMGNLGATLPCPKDCPNRRQCSMFSETFTVEESEIDDFRSAAMLGPAGLVRYDDSELRRSFRLRDAFQTVMDLGDEDDDTGTGGVISEPLEPEFQYKKFNVGREVYTDDPTERRRMPLSKPLSLAMRSIFSYWNTNAIFKSENELRDDFIWLMTKTAGRTIYRNEVEAIMENEAYGRSQKFFHIFYDVVYKEERPDGFYWHDQPSSYNPIEKKFEDKEEFISFFKRERWCRDFYKDHKNEILSFIGFSKESEFIADMVSESIRTTGNIIHINSNSDYSIVNLGRMETFIRNMHTPTDLETMKSMAAFLEQYMIVGNSIVPRDEDSIFEVSRSAGAKEDKCVFEAMGFDRSENLAAQYDYFTALLREYIKTFAPQTVKVGPLQFSKSAFSTELKRVANDFCKDYLIHPELKDEAVMLRKKSHALLAKSIYERNIICTYDIENEREVHEKMSLVTGIVAEYGIYNMHKYIMKLKTGDSAEFCKKLGQDDIVRELFAAKVSSAENLAISRAMTSYQQQYNSFVGSK